MTDQRDLAALATTPSQTVGPFFHVCLAADAGHGRLLPDETPRITLAIRVLDGAGAPVDDALVEGPRRARPPVCWFRSDRLVPTSWVAPVDGKPLEFTTKGQAMVMTLVPLYRLFDERYVVYWNVSRS